MNIDILSGHAELFICTLRRAECNDKSLIRLDIMSPSMVFTRSIQYYAMFALLRANIA